MKQHSIQLVQGPPGTGKTTTITGIVAMILFKNSDACVHICAPSNAAVNEIVDRISKKGLQGNDSDLTDLVIRISSVSHKLPE